MGLKSTFPLIGLCLLIGVAQSELFYGLPNEEQPQEELFTDLQEQAPIIDVDEAQVPELSEPNQEQNVSSFVHFLMSVMGHKMIIGRLCGSLPRTPNKLISTCESCACM